MRQSKKTAKTFTLDPTVLAYVAGTRKGRSASARVNELLLLAMKAEMYAQLEQEAAAFYAEAGKRERKERRAFQRASFRSLARD